MTATARMLIRLAWRNVLRNWRHSIATVLAIASGFTAVSLFDGFIAELKERNNDGYQTRGMLGDVVVQRRDAQRMLAEDFWAYAMTAEEQAFLDAEIAADPAALLRVRFLGVSGLATAGRNNAVFMGNGYDVADGVKLRGERWGWNTIAGKPLHMAETPSMIVGAGMGRLLGCESRYEGPKFTLPDGNYVPAERPFACESPRVTLAATTEAAQVNAIELPVVGIFDGGFRELDMRAVSVPLAEAQRLLDTDKVTLVAVKLAEGADVDAFVARIKRAAAARGMDLDVMRWDEHQIAAYVRGGMQILTVFRNLFMVIVVTIGVMSVANTMMKAVNERIREIGTLRSLGFLRRHLVLLFSLEGFFLSLIACAGGLAATVLLSLVIGELGLSYRAGILSVPIDLRVKAAPWAWIASTVVLTLLATGTAWFCSRRAARMVVADAMRHV